MFNKLKQFVKGVGDSEAPKKQLVIHVKRWKEEGTRTLMITDAVYPTFKLLLRDLAEVHGAELEIIEDQV